MGWLKDLFTPKKKEPDQSLIPLTEAQRLMNRRDETEPQKWNAHAGNWDEYDVPEKLVILARFKRDPNTIEEAKPVSEPEVLPEDDLNLKELP